MGVGNKSSNIKVSVYPLKAAITRPICFVKEKHIIQVEV